MKKNKKSVPTEKKFWIISIAVGICLVVLSVCFFSNADKEKKEANLLDTVNYVKVQCSTYTHYNESSESKSLLRAIEGTRQVSKNIAAETENEKTLDDQLKNVQRKKSYWIQQFTMKKCMLRESIIMTGLILIWLPAQERMHREL